MYVCIIIVILLFWELFTPALSLESDWRQVSSSLQGFSRYSGRFWQNSLHTFSYFHVFLSVFDCIKRINYKWYHHHSNVPQFFQFPRKVQVFILLFAFLQFYSIVSRESKVHNSASSLFLLIISYLVVWPILGDSFLSQNPRGVCPSHSSGQILRCAYTICSCGQISISCIIPSRSPCPPSRV